MRKILLLFFTLSGFLMAAYGQDRTSLGGFKQLSEDIYQWVDVSNVYVIKKNDSAILIDLGNGSVLAHLQEIGVKTIDWILFTHHHREQVQGYGLLQDSSIKIAAPEAERTLFENPELVRKMHPQLEDPFSVYGASYVRPSVDAINLDRSFSAMDMFHWKNLEITCMATKGNSPGGMSYFIPSPKGWIVFSGDVMMAGAKMHTWFDSEWDYGFASGTYALHNAAAAIGDFAPYLMLPSHGPIIEEPLKSLATFQEKLKKLNSELVRGYDVFTYSPSFQDRISQPTSVPFVWRVTPHLYKFKGPDFFPNFAMMMADNGHAIVVDCGLFEERFLVNSLRLMEERLGLVKIDALVISHMHGDHFLNAPLLQKRYGTQIWALDKMVPMIEHPEDFDYAALIESYNKNSMKLKVDRTLKDGEKIDWQGYVLECGWMPGQTEFAMGMQATIDNKKVVFTGDNIFADPLNAQHTGHEALVARNSAILETGYIKGAGYLKELKPDLIVGGHSYIMNDPADLINRYETWSYRMRAILQDLSSLPDYRNWFDPYWIKARPYRSHLAIGTSTTIEVVFTNVTDTTQNLALQIHTPKGVGANPQKMSLTLKPNAHVEMPIALSTTGSAPTGVKIVAFDVTLNGLKLGEWFDCLVEITKK